MDQTYRDTIAKMDENAVDPEYILGWQGGYLGHPKREAQRMTDAYNAGYKDGQSKITSSFKAWKKQ